MTGSRCETTLRDDLAFAVVPLGRHRGQALLAQWDLQRRTLALIAEIDESPSDETVRVQLHNAQRLAEEALDA